MSTDTIKISLICNSHFKKEKITQKYVVSVGLFLGSFMSPFFFFFFNRTVKLKRYQACWIINDTGPRGEVRHPPSSRSGEAGAGLSSRGRGSPGFSLCQSALLVIDLLLI